jgi:hypothetical protein
MDERIQRWTPDHLREFADAHELEIAADPAGRWVPIWVVVVDHGVFVRTWQRRKTGWYGRAVASGRAWIHVADEPVEVVVTPTGDEIPDAVDAAYRAKSRFAGAGSMVTTEAAASTLRLTPAAAR